MLKNVGAGYARWTRLAIIAALAGLTVGACAPGAPMSDAELDRGHQFGPAYQVEHTVHRHLVPVSATNVLIDEAQFRDLYEFLVGVGARGGDRVVLAARRSRLEQRAQVELFLTRVGVHSDLKLIKDQEASAEDDGYDLAILVRFDRYTPRQPQCGVWGEKVKTNYYNTSPRNFGCSTVASRQQQVAYPSSLIEGELLAFPEGDVAAEAITRYRARKVEEIEEVSAGGG
jgi:type IV pilus biogenesis protein CpaD/CtpE